MMTLMLHWFLLVSNDRVLVAVSGGPDSPVCCTFCGLSGRRAG